MGGAWPGARAHLTGEVTYPHNVERDQSETEEYLTAEGDPVLAELWDKEEDAIYDDM